MLVLTVNAGSSSLKSQLVDTTDGSRLVKCHAERIGSTEAHMVIDFGGHKIEKPIEDLGVPEVLELLLNEIENNPESPLESVHQIGAIGNRIVAGGEYFTKAALIGHAEAATQMGFMALNGYGVEKSDKDAYDWFMMAAAKEEPVALYQLGVMYENGVYVEKDLDRAIKYYLHSSDRNNADAKVALARLGK